MDLLAKGGFQGLLLIPAEVAAELDEPSLLGARKAAPAEAVVTVVLAVDGDHADGCGGLDEARPGPADEDLRGAGATGHDQSVGLEEQHGPGNSRPRPCPEGGQMAEVEGLFDREERNAVGKMDHVEHEHTVARQRNPPATTGPCRNRPQERGAVIAG